MKKDELFDLITEFKPDDAFVEEALGEREGAPVRVYAGKAKSPMRIVAPVAACLAIAAAAGIVFANVNRGKPAVGPASEGSALESGETSEAESTPPDNNEIMPTGEWVFPSHHADLVEECKDSIKSKFAQVSQSDAIWQADNMDIDYDGYNELLLCPRVNGSSVKGVGVCVFKVNPDDGDAAYIGSFGCESGSMDLDKFYFDFNTDDEIIYYFNNDEENEKCVDSIQELFLDKSTGIIQEQTYLRLVKTYPNDASSDTPYTETAYRYGAEISTEQLLSEWKTAGEHDNFVIVPTMNGFDAHCEMSEYVQLLVDKYNVPLNGASLNSLHRTVQSLDINDDGENETVIQIQNCEQLRGIYVFSTDGKLIGEFNLEGKWGDSWGTGRIDTISLNTPAEIQKFENDSESYYYFRTIQTETRILNPGRHSVAKWSIYKIVVNEDGTLGAEAIVEYGTEFVGGEGTRDVCRVNGKDVSREELVTEISKHPHRVDPFVR